MSNTEEKTPLEALIHETSALLKRKDQEKTKVEELAQSAYRTLNALGYKDEGGSMWRPPLGKRRGELFDQSEKFRAESFPVAVGSDGMFEAGIDHWRGDNEHEDKWHYGAIVCYASTMEEAQALRERLLRGMRSTQGEKVTEITLGDVTPEMVERVKAALATAGVGQQIVTLGTEMAKDSHAGYEEAFYKIGELIDLGAQPISPAQAFEEQMYPKVKEALEVLPLFKGLQRLMGYVQNGSETTVTLFQDDATYSYHVKIGQRSSYWGGSLREALEKAIEATPKEDWE